VTLDLKALQRMFEMIGSDAEVMAELIQSFFDETPLLVEQMWSAARDKNRVTLGRSAHTLKSTARDFGADPLADLCQALELHCQTDFPENPETQIKAIVDCLNLTHIDLKALGKTVVGGE
jgi:histidine phosphotransfer protein HptB